MNFSPGYFIHKTDAGLYAYGLHHNLFNRIGYSWYSGTTIYEHAGVKSELLGTAFSFEEAYNEIQEVLKKYQ